MEWSLRLPIDLMKCVLVVSHLVKDGIRLCIEQRMNLLAALLDINIHHTSFWNMSGNQYGSEGRKNTLFSLFPSLLGKQSSIIETEETEQQIEKDGEMERSKEGWKEARKDGKKEIRN